MALGIDLALLQSCQHQPSKETTDLTSGIVGTLFRLFLNSLTLVEMYSLLVAHKPVMYSEKLQQNVDLKLMKKETQSLIISISMSKMRATIL